MARVSRSTKAAVEETVEPTVEEQATETSEPTTKQVINEGIARVIGATGIDVQKNRYKAMRAIAFQAFQEAIDNGDFDALVDRAIENVDELPAGWEIERSATDTPVVAPAKAKASPAKAATKAAPTKPAAKSGTATARKRPTR
jgi:ribosomal protein S3AE